MPETRSDTDAGREAMFTEMLGSSMAAKFERATADARWNEDFRLACSSEQDRRVRKRKTKAGHKDVLDGLELFRKMARSKAREEAESREMQLVAQIASRIKASSAWLFHVTNNNTLKAVVSYRTRSRGMEIPINSDKSIVAHVARTNRSYVCDDTENDKRYLETVKQTRSELAIPLCAPDRPEIVIGVLNLEWNSPNQCPYEMIESVSAVAKQLCRWILSWQTTEEDDSSRLCWMPSAGTWSQNRFSRDACNAITSLVSTSDSDDMVASVIWEIDWTKGYAALLGTSGYHESFYDGVRLDEKPCFTARVMRWRRGKCSIRPWERRVFALGEEGESAGAQFVMSAPLYALASNDRPLAVWHLFQFGNDQDQRLPGEEVGSEIAWRLGTWISRFYEDRVRMARAYLEAKLYSCRDPKLFDSPVDHSSEQALIETFEKVIGKVLSADGVSIFAPDLEGKRLVQIGGSQMRYPWVAWKAGQLSAIHPGDKLSWDDISSYDLERDSGVMTFLFRNPHVKGVRINSTGRFSSERGLPRDTGFPEGLSLKHLECLTPDTCDRRFIGISVHDQGGPVQFVVRVVRTSVRPPFSEDDLHLLRELGDQFSSTWKVLLSNRYRNS